MNHLVPPGRSEPEPAQRARWPGRLALCAALAVLALWSLALAPRGLFSGDFGVKYFQAHALWEQDFGTRALPYATDVDPAGTFFPLVPRFFRTVDGERQGIYSILFIGAVAPLLGVFGHPGLHVWPCLGAVLGLLGTRRLGGAVGLSPGRALAAAIGVGLGTPVLFYSGQLSEHTLATGFVVLALAQLIDGRPGPTRSRIHAGLLAGLAGAIRPEGYLAIAALGLVDFLGPGSLAARVRRAIPFAGGALALLGCYWALNLATAGTWDPLVAVNAAQRTSSTGVAILLWGEMLKAANWPRVILAAIPFGLGLAATWLIPERQAASARWLRWAIGGALVGVGLWAQQASTARTLAGLFSVTPFAVLGLLAPARSARDATKAWQFAVVFLLLVLVLDKSQNGGGLQFGARLLLPCLPVFIVVALHHWQQADLASIRTRTRWLYAAVPVLLIGLSARGFATGMRQACVIAQQGADSVAAVLRTDTTDIVARRWWEAQILAPVVSEGRQVYFASENTDELLAALAANGRQTVILATSRSPESVGGRPATARVIDRGLIPLSLIELPGADD